MLNSILLQSDLFDPKGNRIQIKKRKNIKKVRLKYDQNESFFTLYVPYIDYAHDLHNFIKRSNPWMLKQLDKPKMEGHKIFVKNDAEIFVLGKKYKLKLEQNLKKSCVFKGDVIEINAPSSQFLGVLEQSLKDLIKKILYQRCYVYAKKMNKQFLKVSIKDTKTRWGSCSSKGNLNFSWRLIFAPSPVVDYLCLHEVAHLAEMNHSPKFWEIVEKLMPDYKKRKKWLKDNAFYLLNLKFEQ